MPLLGGVCIIAHGASSPVANLLAVRKTRASFGY
jgi:hypothetical protein